MPTKAAELVRNPMHQLICSAASIWEVAIKHSNGARKPNNIPMSGSELYAEIAGLDITLLSISPFHAAAVGDLPHYHRDPFDRLIVATAKHEGMTLLTHDKKLADYGDFVMVV